MGWFKQLMGLEAPHANTQSKEPGQAVPTTGPLGLAPGKGVIFDTSLKLLLDGKTTVIIPGTPTAATTMSALDVIAARSFVLEWAMVTVASVPRAANSSANGRPSV
jgi:hypothetical protein